MSNEIKLHPTSSKRAPEVLEKHVGSLLAPPATMERVKAIGPFVTHDFEVSGDSWKKACYDLVIAGLGWVAVTGPGLAKVRITVPVGTSVSIRPSFLPYEAPSTTVGFTGGKLIRRNKPRTPGLGWRA